MFLKFPQHGILPPGTIVNGCFVIEKLLHHSEFSDVYLASDRRSGRKVVIKRLSTSPKPGGLERAAAAAGFVEEARLLGSLSHPRIPRLYDAFQLGEDYYMIQQYIFGYRLDDLIKRKILPHSTMYAIAEDLCELVSYLHHRARPIVHADLKPSNVLIAPDCQAFLLDMGISRYANEEPVIKVAMGSLPYTSPEQLRGIVLTERSDIYALGVLFEELFAPEPFDPLYQICKCAAANHPRRRYADVLELRDDIRDAGARLLMFGCETRQLAGR